MGSWPGRSQLGATEPVYATNQEVEPLGLKSSGQNPKLGTELNIGICKMSFRLANCRVLELLFLIEAPDFFKDAFIKSRK